MRILVGTGNSSGNVTHANIKNYNCASLKTGIIKLHPIYPKHISVLINLMAQFMLFVVVKIGLIIIKTMAGIRYKCLA